MNIVNFIKKNHIVVSVFLIIICLCVEVNHMKQEKMILSSEKYGTQNDNYITIDDKMEIRVDFTIQHDNFYGLAIGLELGDKNYTDEVLNFKMYDSKTHKLLSEYNMDLKYEMDSTRGYADLSLKESSQKDVYIIITGNNLNQQPHLIVSDECGFQSTLMIDDIVQDTFLVMEAQYTSYSNDFIEAIVNVILFTFFVLVVNWWIFKKDNIGILHGETDFYKIEKFLLKNKKKLKVMGLTFFLIILYIFVYKEYVEDVCKKEKTKIIMSISESTDDIILDKEINELEQTFVCKKEYLSEISWRWKLKNIDKDTKIKIKILNLDAGEEIYSQIVDLDNEIEDKYNWYSISLNKAYINSKDVSFSIKILPINMSGTKIKIASTGYDKYKKNILYLNGIERYDDCAIKLGYADFSVLKIMYIILCVVVSAFLILCFYCLALKKIAIEKCFATIAFALGIIYLFVITMYGVPDEPSHIDTAYRYSNYMMGISEPENSFYTYKRSDDVDMQVHALNSIKQNVGKESYLYLFNNLFSKVKNDELVKCFARNNSNNASFIFYLPASLGITIGRFFGLGTLPMLLLGRLMNLSVYIFLVYFAIKKIPFGKNGLAVIALLPITLQEAASFSYDSMVNGISFLFIGYCLNLIYGECVAIKTSDMIIFLGLCLLVASVKGGVYLPLCIMMLLIPIKRGYLKKEMLQYYLIVLILCGLFFLKNNIINIVNRMTSIAGASTGQTTSNGFYTFSYLLSHPLKVILLYANTISSKGENLLKGLLGGNLGWLNIPIPWYFLIGILFIYIWLSMSVDNNKIKIRVIDKIFALCAIIGCFFLVNLSMLVSATAFGENIILGVQGRYFIPFIPLVYLLIKKKKIHCQEGYLFFAYCCIHVCIIFHIITEVL